MSFPSTVLSSKLGTADVSDDKAKKIRDEPKTSSYGIPQNIVINLTKLDENEQKKNSSPAILHTVTTSVGDKKLKILIDNGADATVAMKRCYEKLGLVPKAANRTLHLTTINGHTSSTSKYVEVKFSDELKIKAFALDKNYNLDSQKVDLTKLWPTLDKNLAKEVKENICSGNLDLIIGLDALYGRVSNTNYILHQERGLALMHTVFGYSIGGTTQLKNNFHENTDIIRVLTSTFEAKYQDEPTKQKSVEREIQENMANLFKTEVDVGSTDSKNYAKTSDERFVVEQFKKTSNLQRWWVLRVISTYV